MATVLIASLGDSPVVVTSMFDLLRSEPEQHGIKHIDKLEVLCPDPDNTAIGVFGYDELVCKPLKEKYPACAVENIPLSYADVDDENAAYDFLRKLYHKLNEHQDNRDVVYLSLAGGRKSMSALMALLAPLSPCVQKLYHILDQDEGQAGHFKSTTELYGMSEQGRKYWLFPSGGRVTLVNIPYGEKQRASREFMARLYNLTDEQQLNALRESDPEQAEKIEFYSPLTQSNDEGGLLTVELTENAVKQYEKFLSQDVNRGRKFTTCFHQMRFANRLMVPVRTNKEDGAHGTYKSKSLGRTFHFYKSHEHTTERIVYHTEPQDIAATSAAYIKKVVISELEFEVSGRYRKLEEIVSSPSFSLEGREDFDDFLEKRGLREHILIIPLATTPMVATQLYQLYINRGYKVRSVILVHTQDREVRKSLEIVRDAFASEGVPCEARALEKWKDIDSKEACEAYQELLERVISQAHQQNPSCRIELTVSGGRKAMAAMATFAAQKQGIRRIAHTLIDERLDKQVSEETTMSKLKELANTNRKNVRNDRLFLRAYEQDLDAFKLFTIPVIPAQKEEEE